MRFGLVVFIISALLIKADISFSQENDAQLWENISITKKLSKTLSLNFNHEGRFANNCCRLSMLYGDFGIIKKLGKSWKVGGNYVIAYRRNVKRTSWRHQFYIYSTLKENLSSRLSLSWRLMYQQQYSDILSSEQPFIPETLLRNKFTLKYHFLYYPWYRFSPYLATELYYNLDNNSPFGQEFNRTRIFAGCYYNFNKTTAIELYFMTEFNYNIKNPPTNYVYGIGFEKDF